MAFLERYIDGQTKQVYEDIDALSATAFLPEKFPEIEKVLSETFRRVADNLAIIYSELKQTGYLFKTESVYNFEKPLHHPLPDTDILLDKLDLAVAPFGFIPLSLKYFYQITGGVNFTWDYETSIGSRRRYTELFRRRSAETERFVYQLRTRAVGLFLIMGGRNGLTE